MTQSKAISVKLKAIQKILDTGSRAVIQPSVKLSCVNVHKLKDLQTCDRLYFWRWVLNLEPKRLSMPFWFGTMVHKAMEFYVQGAKLKKMFKCIDIDSKKFISRYALMPEMAEELAVQKRVIKTIIKVYTTLFKDSLPEQLTVATEKSFRYQLDKTPVVLVGTIDWHGYYKKLRAIKEYKTATLINDEYFSKLLFDKQLNGYAIGYKALTKKLPEVCPYVVFRKPQIKCRQNETVDMFIARLSEDLVDRQDWYFLQEDIRFTKQMIESVQMDIEWLVYDLFCKYEELSTEQLLNPDNWPRCEGSCFNYGICPYFSLCKNNHAYKTFLQLFQMREIRYKEERAELGEVMKMKYVQSSVVPMLDKSNVHIPEDGVLNASENY